MIVLVFLLLLERVSSLHFQPSTLHFKRKHITSLRSTIGSVESLSNVYEKYEDRLDLYPYDDVEEMKLMIYSDISAADNYYETTLPSRKKKRAELTTEDRLKFDDNFYKLMNAGFNKRALNDISTIKPENKKNINTILSTAAMKTAFHLELGKSKDEQMRDLKKIQRAQRPGLLKLLPQDLLKYYDYFLSLRSASSKIDILRNLALGSFFGFVIWANMSARSSFMYYVIGNLAMMSFLLTKNMPKQKVMPGMDKKKVISWSQNAFKTAVALTSISSLLSGLTMVLLLSPFPLSLSAKLKAAMISGLLCTSVTTTFFEVFEEKGKNGWRWEKAMQGNPSLDTKIESSTTDSIVGSEKLGDKYEYEYNPHIAEFPPQPKYIDEVNGSTGDMKLPGGSGELDEDESNKHYESWKLERRDARRAPIEHAPPETPWVGSKVGMYVDKVPTWLSKAYKQYVLKANAWRTKKPKFVKDTTEFEMIDGPKGFRDKRPDWLNLFGSGIWEEKTTVSRRAARAFGAYRKSMWKIDNKVQLQKCDGADKDTKK